VVGDDGEHPADTERGERRDEPFVELTFFTVHGDAKRLKNPRRNVTATAGGFGHSALDRLAQLVGRARLAFVDRFRDGTGEPTFTVRSKQPSEFVLIRARKELSCGLARCRVHSHVEWRVGAKRKAPASLIKLVRGDAEVHQNPDDVTVADEVRVASYHAAKFGEGRLHDQGPVAEGRKLRSRFSQRRRIAIDPEDSKLGGCAKQRFGVSGAAQGSVDHHASRLAGEQLDDLCRKYRFVKVLLGHPQPFNRDNEREGGGGFPSRCRDCQAARGPRPITLCCSCH
jgi:hypothetical protein